MKELGHFEDIDINGPLMGKVWQLEPCMQMRRVGTPSISWVTPSVMSRLVVGPRGHTPNVQDVRLTYVQYPETLFLGVATI